jgi:hypothetical protein
MKPQREVDLCIFLQGQRQRPEPLHAKSQRLKLWARDVAQGDTETRLPIAVAAPPILGIEVRHKNEGSWRWIDSVYWAKGKSDNKWKASLCSSEIVHGVLVTPTCLGAVAVMRLDLWPSLCFSRFPWLRMVKELGKEPHRSSLQRHRGLPPRPTLHNPLQPMRPRRGQVRPRRHHQSPAPLRRHQRQQLHRPPRLRPPHHRQAST